MTTLNRFSWTTRLVVPILFTLIFTGCTRVNAAPPPTRTPIPTFTPSPTYDVLATMVADAALATETASAPTITPTPTTTETPTVTPTPTVAAPQVVVKSPVNVRVGPALTHALIGSAQPGERFSAIAKSNDGAWWQIEYNGQNGWVFGELVAPENTDTLSVAVNVPTAPPPPPPPTATPTLTPVATNTPVPTNTPTPDYTYALTDMGSCTPTGGLTEYRGNIEYANGSRRNNICVHIAFWGPRQTKCSGCDIEDEGEWGFAPFGDNPPTDTWIEIYVINCPSSGIPPGGQNADFVNLTPLSPKWTHKVSGKEFCQDITFTSDE
ncbi:MAG: SH3 domain-containing protein [Caldilineaceae bacterium]